MLAHLIWLKQIENVNQPKETVSTINYQHLKLEKWALRFSTRYVQHMCFSALFWGLGGIPNIFNN